MPKRNFTTVSYNDDDLSLAYRAVGIAPYPYDTLDTTLHHAIEMLRFRNHRLSYRRHVPALARVVYRLYLDVELGWDEQSVYLGKIDLRKTQENVTETVIERMALRDSGAQFRELVFLWKAYLVQDKEVAELVQESSKESSTEDNHSVSRQKGRYRLTAEDIKQRKKIVKIAQRMYKESSPRKTWKRIAYELDVPERTLRAWRHDPTI